MQAYTQRRNERKKAVRSDRWRRRSLCLCGDFQHATLVPKRCTKSMPRAVTQPWRAISSPKRSGSLQDSYGVKKPIRWAVCNRRSSVAATSAQGFQQLSCLGVSSTTLPEPDRMVGVRRSSCQFHDKLDVVSVSQMAHGSLENGMKIPSVLMDETGGRPLGLRVACVTLDDEKDERRPVVRPAKL